LTALTDTTSGEAIPLERICGQKVAAFCGIGNPAAFFADIRRWQFNLIVEDAFPDHHVYTEPELQRLAVRARTNGAAAVLTTEKDAVKFSRNWQLELPILACAVETPIHEGEEFERFLLTYLDRPERAEG
jgi:tetraacyldisaccharide 4'-kinase